MLVEMAIADAYGAGREFAPPEFVRVTNDGRSYVQNPRFPDLTPGRYTDDTQMTLGVTQWLLSKAPRNQLGVASHFVDVFRRDRRKGYADGFYDLLCRCKSGMALVYALQSTSVKNGGAMRAAPCGFMKDLSDAVDLAMLQASVTHATKPGMDAAGAVAALVWAARHGCDWDYLPVFLDGTIPGYHWLDADWPAGMSVPTYGIATVKAALSSVMAGAGSMTETMVRAVGLTGDTDTVATIAMAITAVHPMAGPDLDPGLYDRLEDGRYGRKFLAKLDDTLCQRFPCDDATVVDLADSPAFDIGDTPE